jgi:5-methylcytosine-specific restriction endonuclease McrA
MCGRDRYDGVKLEVDHIIPVLKGGSDDISNLQTLCFDCNRGESDKILHNQMNK